MTTRKLQSVLPLALGLGVLALGAASLSLSPRIAFAQTGCGLNDGKLCREKETCLKWDTPTICSEYVKTYAYWGKY